MKYPRTYHIPDSPGRASDDKVLSYEEFTTNFVGQHVVITEKYDGENFSLYRDRIHARSPEPPKHPSHSWIKAFWSERQHLIPENCRVCGEYLYAKHSIKYECLESYFLGFQVWDIGTDTVLSWSQTQQFFSLLNVMSARVLYEGILTENAVDDIIKKLDTNVQEGFVIRLYDEFKISDFNRSVCKWVRPNHVTDTQHWSTQPTVKNKLK